MHARRFPLKNVDKLSVLYTPAGSVRPKASSKYYPSSSIWTKDSTGVIKFDYERLVPETKVIEIIL